MKSLFMGIPAHDGKVETSFFFAGLNTSRALDQHQIPSTWYVNSGESLVQRARNNIAQVFLNSAWGKEALPYTHMLMIDTDLGFHPAHVLRLLELCDDEHPIVAGMAPLKTIDWAAVGAAARGGAPDDDLRWVGSRNVVNPVDHYDYADNASALVPVKYAGTGMMMITRNALEKFRAAYPELSYTPDYRVGAAEFDNAPHKVTAFFDTMICPDENRYLSEDYTFCKRARAIGLETHVCRDVLVEHIGKYTYAPNRSAL